MLFCTQCNQTYPVNQPRWRCECGSYLTLRTEVIFDPEELANRPPTIWRYHEALCIEDQQNIVSLGEGFTPLLADTLFEQPVYLKMDQLCPTGSFKDRGSSVMVSKLKEWGIDRVVEDSSGNAGASVAAYTSRAGIRSSIYVPAYTSLGKTAQIGLYGASLVKVPGTREDTTKAVLQAAEETFYASHNWSPYFVAGLKTLAYEICEQLGWQAPDWVVAPVGGGSLVLGIYQGFSDLLQAGIIDKLPRLAAVQAENCAPVYQAWKQQLDDVPAITKLETAAEGISISQPVKGRDILQAIYASNGVAITVNDEEIWQAIEILANRGIYVEPTSGAAPAAVKHLLKQGLISPGERVVVELTGMGLKATDKILAHLSE